MNVDRVLLASPRGFCAGVEMAIKALAWMVRVFEPPVYCYHEIVHNQVVVERFRELGVVFVDDVDDVPEGAPLMLSAHGSAPEVVDAARARGGAVVNAVCPLVTKVHHEVKVRAAKGYTIVYVGHEGHEEAVGTLAVAPDAVHRVEKPSDVEALAEPVGPVAFLAQTTLAVDEWQDMLGRGPRALARAVGARAAATCASPPPTARPRCEAIADRCDAVVVIGSANSSNTLALERTARAAGCPRVLRVNSRPSCPTTCPAPSGSSPGPPPPRSWSTASSARLAPHGGVEEVRAVDEDEYFPLPRELRDLLRTVAAAAAVAGLAPAADPGDVAGDDRETAASEVLAALAQS